MSGLSRIQAVLRGRSLKTPAGATRVVLPRPGSFPSFYVFALHKSGSTLLNAMLREALDGAGVPQIALSEHAFAAGLPENEITNPELFIFPQGYCYRGYREFPPYLRTFDISKNRKILLVRDPRDMLVSDYFSTAFSHELPRQGVVREQLARQRDYAQNVDINDYCLSQATVYKNEFDGYHHLIDGEIRIYRYEDVIFAKCGWLADMLAYFEINVPEQVMAAIAARHDVRPERENPGAHIRQVTPGNYRLHLNAATIDSLNRQFATELTRYGYEAELRKSS